jgi:hypothetical protein
MNTIHVSRPLDVDEGRAAAYARTIGLTLLLCAAVFAGCFLLGRSERPAAIPREQLSVGPAAAASGSAIPTRLASAPPIEAEAPAVVAAPARSSSPASAGSTPASAAQPALVSAVPSTPAPAASTPAPATSTPTTPTVRVTPVSPQQHAGGTAPTPARGTSGGTGGAKTETSGSTSFDSSG